MTAMKTPDDGDTPMMCLGDDSVLAYVEGRREPAVEAHLADCPACRRRVTAIAITQDDWSSESNALEPAVRRLVSRQLGGTRTVAPRSPMWIPIAAAAAIALAIIGIWSATRTPAEDPTIVRKPKPVITPQLPPPAPETPKPAPQPELPKPEPQPEIPKPEAQPPGPEPQPPKPEPQPPTPEPQPQPPKSEPVPDKPKPTPTPEPEPTEVTRAASGPARIEATSGLVKVQRKGQWVKTGARAELADGDRLKVEGGARISMPDGGTLCIDDDSEVVFDRLAELPNRITLATGEVHVDGCERIYVRSSAVEVAANAAAFHVKAMRDDATVTLYSGDAECRNEKGKLALAAGSQLSAAKSKAPESVKRVSSTQLAGWADGLRAIAFMDEFEGGAIADLWGERGPGAKGFEPRIDKGQLACRAPAEKGEQWRTWMLWTKHGVKVEGTISFEATCLVDRAAGIMPRVTIAAFDEDHARWRFDYAASSSRESLIALEPKRGAPGGGRDKDKEGEKELRDVGSGLRPGKERKIEFILDARQLIVALDGIVFWRGMHELKDLDNVYFGIGQGGRADGKVSEVRFDKVRIGPVRK